MALKKGRRVPKLTAEPMEIDEDNMGNVHNAVLDVQPLAMVVEPLQLEDGPDKSVARFVYSANMLSVLLQIQFACNLHDSLSFNIGEFIYYDMLVLVGTCHHCELVQIFLCLVVIKQQQQQPSLLVPSKLG
jgi:hypothetical protein